MVATGENSSVLIEIRDVNFKYGGRPVLDGLSFCFSEGERVGLIGPNGSGKTTFFHVVMGLLKPESGELRIFGKSRNREKDFVEVRRRIGFVFQDPDDQLFSPTVAEDVAFGPLNLGVPRERVMEIVSDTLNMLGLAGFENRITHKLSGGEKRLVSLATVLAMNPEILLLDEPTSGLDEKTVVRLITILKNLSTSYIIASHDRDFLKEVTTKLYRMEGGKLWPVADQEDIASGKLIN